MLDSKQPKLSWNHSLVQTAYVGLLAFLCPGMFNAVISLGKAGGDDAVLASAALASLYTCFVFFGFFGGPCFNLFGSRVLMFVGGLTYCIYAIGITFSKYVIVNIICGATLGFGAGWFWTAQGALMMAYAPPNRKGFYISIFWVIFNLGGVIGGLSTMMLNWYTTESSASMPTRIVYAVLMLLGAFGSLALCKPNKVIREDGEPCEILKASSAKSEIKSALMMVMNRNMQLLTLMFFVTNFLYAYQFEGINGLYFTMRTRGFNSALYWGSQMIGSIFIGKVLDNKKYSTRNRGYIGFFLMSCVLLATFLADFLYSTLMKPSYLVRTYDAAAQNWIQPDEKSRIDITQPSLAAVPITIYFFYGFADAMFQSFAYWLISTLSGNNLNLAANSAGYYKAVQSFGAAVSWILSIFLSFTTQLWTGVVLVVICLPFAAMTINNLPEA